MTQLTEPDGAVLFFDNQADGLRFSKTDGLGYQTRYSYKADQSFDTASDTGGNVTREQDALNNTSDMTYGIYDQVATLKDKRGTIRTTSFHATTDATCQAAGKPEAVTLSVLGPVPNVKLQALCWFPDGALKSATDYLTPGSLTRTRTRTLGYLEAAHLNVQSVTEG